MTIIRAYLAVPMIGRGVFLIILVIACILGTERWVWGPARAQHKALKQDVIALQNAKLTNQARVDATADFAQTQAHLSILETKLAASIDRSGVVEILADLSRVSEVQIIHGANTFGRPRDTVRPVLQDLTVEGSYAQVAGFVSQLSQIETLTLLRRAEFSTNADGTLVRAQLKLMTLNERRAQ